MSWCERCSKEPVMICLNGMLWLCWNCYVAEMRVSDPPDKEAERNG